MKGTKRVKILKYVTLILCCIVIIFGSLFCLANILCPVKYLDIVKTECEKYNINQTLVLSLINAESHFKNDIVSNKGAIGLMQIMPSTAVFVASELDLQNFEINKLFEPRLNIKIGVYYLNYLIEKFGDIKTSLCAYNAGEGVVNSWLNNIEYSTDNVSLKVIPFNETQNYVSRILTYQKIYSILI